MEKKKDTTKKQFSHAIKASRHKTNKAFIMIDGIVIIEDGCRIFGKGMHKSSTHPPINFNLQISDDDLHRLFSYACNSNSDFSGQFSLVLADAIEQTKTGARGKHKGHETSLFWIKQEASFLHTLFSFINDSNTKPEYFINLIEKIPPDDRLYFKKGKGHDPVALTAYVLEKLHGVNRLKSLALKPFHTGSDGLESFYITYIQPGRQRSEAEFKAIMRPILLRLTGVKHLCKKDQKCPHVFTVALARREDMVPCDDKGNAIEVAPMGKKNPHYQDALLELFEEIRKETLFKLMF